MIKISASIVLFNTKKEFVDNVLLSCSNSSVQVDLYLIDNSENDNFSYLKESNNLTYVKSDTNLGFGGGHNFLIRNFNILDKYDYHVVINPDIEFDEHVIESISNNMSEDIGVLMPRIIDEGGSLQYARRLLPRPIDILIKRFLPTMSKFLKYELPGLEVKDAINMPGLCGCFLFFNTKVLKITGLFDERFFMYYEDIDICRRIYALSKSIYFPLVSVKHHSNNEHRRNLRVFYYALVASLLYFNKWGFFDKKAKLLNNKIYKQFTYLGKKGA